MEISAKNQAQLALLTGQPSKREAKTISSREVAGMMEVNHKDLLEKIDKISNDLRSAESSANLSKYWTESQYQSGQNKQYYREYQITKRGCEFLAHKTIGTKGNIFTDRYMDKFEEMKIQLQDSYMISDPIERAKRWIQEQEEKQALQLTVKVQEQQIAELQPKASYFDTILQSKDAIPISVIAKDYGIGAPTMNKRLHELGVQYKQGDIWLLYHKYQDQGYTQTKTHNIPQGDGTSISKIYTYWTPKGRMFIYNLLKE